MQEWIKCNPRVKGKVVESRDAESQTESGVKRFLGLGSRESGVAKFFFKMPDSRLPGNVSFFREKLRKCDISEKTSCKIVFYKIFFGWLTVAGWWKLKILWKCVLFERNLNFFTDFHIFSLPRLPTIFGD